ncbi:MAG TPA: hypothetical protein VH325_04335 [Bryobacteraceae bacterium]|jgi:hypothetical protein|nr:hypothetical protein [Bryobacteraceae bacterium]
MCDYSLYVFKSRLAQDGEELTVHRFPTGSLGFASTSDVAAQTKRQEQQASWWAAFKNWMVPRRSCEIPAVCVPPGARLLLAEIPRSLQNRLGVGGMEPVEFTQRSSQLYTYRDSVRFRNGVQVLLQDLAEGTRATVLSIEYEELTFEAEVNAAADEISRTS